MSYRKRLDHAFANAPVLPLTPDTRYVFFSDCHRGIGNANDNFLKNSNSYFAALQYYYQYGFCYIEVGDGDELWENRCVHSIIERNKDVFELFSRFHRAGRFYMIYGNHDMIKKKANPPFVDLPVHEGIILASDSLPRDLYVTHGHQVDLLNSVFWRLARFLVRYLWGPLERLGIQDPTSASKNNHKKEKLESRYLSYAKDSGRLLLVGHTHRPTLGDETTPYYNCGSCVHPRSITCIELCGYQISLVKWYTSTESLGNHYAQCPPAYPIYIRREELSTQNLLHS